MTKLLTNLKRGYENVRWLTRRRGGLQTRIAEMEQCVARIESHLSRMQAIESAKCYAFGHHMQVNPNDQVITMHLNNYGCFEPFETSVVHRLIKPGQTVLDVGANIGYYTLQFAKLVGPSGYVYAFEPDPDNFALLRKNVAQNGYPNVVNIQKAVSDRASSIRLYRNTENHGDHRIYETADDRQYVEVESISIDEFAATLDRPIDLIKFDIQGAEAIAFAGMQKLLRDNRNLKIVMEFWPRGLTLTGTDPREFLEQLLSLGFNVQVIDENEHKIKDLDIDAVLKRYPVEPDCDIFFTNLICSRNAA